MMSNDLSETCVDNSDKHAFTELMGLRERIIESREHAGKSQGDVAAHLKISRSAVSQWEKPKSPTAPTCDRLRELAQFLNVDLLWLLTGTPATPSLTAVEARAAAIASQLSEADANQWLRWGEAMVNAARIGPKEEEPGPKSRAPFSNAS